MKIREQHICGMQQKQGLEGDVLWSLKRNKKHSLKNKPPNTYTLSKDNIYQLNLHEVNWKHVCYPLRRAWQPTPVFLPGEFHKQRSLGGYSL